MINSQWKKLLAEEKAYKESKMRDHVFSDAVLAEHTPYTASDLNSIVVALKDCPDVSAEDVVHLIKERQTYLEQEPDNGEA